MMIDDSQTWSLHLGFQKGWPVGKSLGNIPLWVVAGVGTELDWCKVVLTSLVHLGEKSRHLKWHGGVIVEIVRVLLLILNYRSLLRHSYVATSNKLQRRWKHDPTLQTKTNKINKTREVKCIRIPGAVGSGANSRQSCCSAITHWILDALNVVCYIQSQRQTDQSWILWINDLQNHGCHCRMSLADVRYHLTPFAFSVPECQGRGLRYTMAPHTHTDWHWLDQDLQKQAETTSSMQHYATLCDDFLRLLPQISSLWSGTVSDISSFRFHTIIHCI